MRKYNEGYSLVLVLVVLTVIALLATFILSFSLSNLQNQQASLNRMQEEYAAAGEIEKSIVKLESQIDAEVEEITVVIDDGDVSWEDLTVIYSAEIGTVKIQCKVLLVAESMHKNENIENGYQIIKWSDVIVVEYDVTSVSREVAPE